MWVLHSAGSDLHGLVITSVISNTLSIFCSLSLVVLGERLGTY